MSLVISWSFGSVREEDFHPPLESGTKLQTKYVDIWWVRYYRWPQPFRPQALIFCRHVSACTIMLSCIRLYIRFCALLYWPFKKYRNVHHQLPAWGRYPLILPASWILYCRNFRSLYNLLPLLLQFHGIMSLQTLVDWRQITSQVCLQAEFYLKPLNINGWRSVDN